MSLKTSAGLLLPIAAAFCMLGIVTEIPACAMSALIASGRHTLDAFPAQGSIPRYYEYNDPWDYLGFVMAHSSPYGNSDGYGVVAYRADEPALDPQHVWYKRVTGFDDFGQVYYTGSHLDEGTQSSACEQDILDIALRSLNSPATQPAIVLAHARSATGLTIGNHPFWFHDRERTYTLMHNGNCNSARSLMIARIEALYPESDWFLEHPSNMGETDPHAWVDSELLFHFIVCHIQTAENNVLIGLRNALGDLSYYIDRPQYGVINFIFSDGEKLYAFRSSAQNSSYQLSYRNVDNSFYGIRTQPPGPGDAILRQRELVVFARGEKPLHIPDFSRSEISQGTPGTGQPGLRQKPLEIAPGLDVSPNPFTDAASIRVHVASPGELSVRIYNLRGELVWSEERFVTAPGLASLSWNGVQATGAKAPAGIYLLKVTYGRAMKMLRICRLAQ